MGLARRPLPEIPKVMSVNQNVVSRSTLGRDADPAPTRRPRLPIDPAQHYAAIIESSEDAILSKDLDGVILSWNLGAERLFGYKADEAIGKPVTILIPTERHNEEPAILDKIRRGEPVQHYETVRQ